jgi:hypothetical protein
MSTLYLPDGVRTAVWRLVKAQLRADTVLSRPFITQVFFEGAGDREEIQSLQSYGTDVVVRYLCTLGSMSWWNERSQVGALVVSYETFVRSLDDEDALNVQEAIESALYPDDGFAFHQSLIDAYAPGVGAVTGQPHFVTPLTTPLSAAGREGTFRPTGQFVIEVERGFPA